MKSPKQIACIGFWSEYDQLFFENTKLENCQVTVLNPYKYLERIISPAFLIKPLRTLCLRNTARRLIQDHTDHHILIHDERVMVDALLSVRKNVQASVLMRNSLNDNGKTGMRILDAQQENHTIWSFDSADCNKHGFQYYRQFISKIGPYENTPVKIDFGFLGKDKGRKAELESLKKTLAYMGYQCEIDLRVGARKKQSGLVDKSYLDYLEQICSARCIIDIVQDNQAGITLRPLEATIYQRKLITNSERVLELSFYHPDNVFILGHDTWDRLTDFMATPFLKLNQAQIAPYLTESMFDVVCNGHGKPD